MTRTKFPAAALITLLVVALATPATADSLDKELQRRDASKSKKAKLAAELDALKAEDGQLETAVRTLDSSVEAQQSTAAAASQAVGAAQAEVNSAEGRLAATEKKMGDLRNQVSAVALRAYVHPGGDTLLDIVRAKDLAEASRRETMLSHIANNDRAVLGELRAAREDQQAQQDNLTRLRDQAEARRKAASERLANLEKSLADQNRLRGALDGRIRSYTAEVDALNAEQANIESLIRSRQTAAPPAQARGGNRSGGSGNSGGNSGGGGGGDSGPRPASASGLVWPASGPVTSGFGMRWGRMHNGIDISAGTGSTIRAAKAGTIISAGSQGGYGLAIIIDHGGGFTTLYAHQSRFAVTGGSVGTGEVIGYVGCTGSCTGPHLHFETRVGGSARNPMNYL
jgi:murein DD-endopeptidase MepM/ murein hydrolase activator NlpD